MKKLIFVFAIILGITTLAFGQHEDEATRDSLRLMEEMGIRGEGGTPGAELEVPGLGALDGRTYGEYRFKSGYASEVALSSYLTFVANVYSLEVLSIADPEKPKYLTSVSTPWSIGVASHGSYVFVTDKYRGLDIYYYDAEKNQLQHISNFHHSSGVQYRFIEVQGCYAYISCKYGLEVVDISDLANPQHEIYISKGSLNKDLAVSGNWVFVSGAYQGVHLFDFKDYFASGGSVHQYTLTYSPSHGSRNSYDVAVDGELLYVADYYNGLEIFDWQEFLSGGTYWLGECYDGIKGNPTGVAVDGDWAYITTFTDGGFLFVVDVTTPSFDMTPYAAYKNSDGGMDPVPYGNWVAFVSGRWYPKSVFFTIDGPVYGSGGVGIVNPPGVFAYWIAHEPLPFLDMLGGWIVIQGNSAYILGDSNCLVHRYDISYPLDPVYGGHSDRKGFGYSADIHGDRLYVSSDAGLVELSIPDLSTEGTNTDIVVYGQVLIYHPFAIVTGIGKSDGIRNFVVHATYDISLPDLPLLDTLYDFPQTDDIYGGYDFFGLTFYPYPVSESALEYWLFVNNSLGGRSVEWTGSTGFPAGVIQGLIHYSYLSPTSGTFVSGMWRRYNSHYWSSSYTQGTRLIFDINNP